MAAAAALFKSGIWLWCAAKQSQLYKGLADAAEPPTSRRIARRLARARRGEIRRRLLFREIWRHPRVGDRQPRGTPAALAEGARPRLGYRRIRHVAARHLRAHPA